MKSIVARLVNIALFFIVLRELFRLTVLHSANPYSSGKQGAELSHRDSCRHDSITANCNLALGKEHTASSLLGVFLDALSGTVRPAVLPTLRFFFRFLMVSGMNSSLSTREHVSLAAQLKT
jgi:hypothetical protein